MGSEMCIRDRSLSRRKKSRAREKRIGYPNKNHNGRKLLHSPGFHDVWCGAEELQAIDPRTPSVSLVLWFGFFNFVDGSQIEMDERSKAVSHK